MTRCFQLWSLQHPKHGWHPAAANKNIDKSQHHHLALTTKHQVQQQHQGLTAATGLAPPIIEGGAASYLTS